MIPSIVFFPVVGRADLFEYILDCADGYVYTNCSGYVFTWSERVLGVWEIMEFIQGFSELDSGNADSWRLISAGFMHARIEMHED